jgi:hypothetical protein
MPALKFELIAVCSKVNRIKQKLLKWGGKVIRNIFDEFVTKKPKL